MVMPSFSLPFWLARCVECNRLRLVRTSTFTKGRVGNVYADLPDIYICRKCSGPPMQEDTVQHRATELIVAGMEDFWAANVASEEEDATLAFTYDELFALVQEFVAKAFEEVGG